MMILVEQKWQLWQCHAAKTNFHKGTKRCKRRHGIGENVCITFTFSCVLFLPQEHLIIGTGQYLVAYNLYLEVHIIYHKVLMGIFCP